MGYGVVHFMFFVESKYLDKSYLGSIYTAYAGSDIGLSGLDDSPYFRRGGGGGGIPSSPTSCTPLDTS